MSEKVEAPIFTNIIFLDDLQYFDDKMDDFTFHIVNFRHISTCTTYKNLVPVFQKVDSTIHQINLYSVD